MFNAELFQTVGAVLLKSNFTKVILIPQITNENTYVITLKVFITANLSLVYNRYFQMNSGLDH